MSTVIGGCPCTEDELFVCLVPNCGEIADTRGGGGDLCAMREATDAEKIEYRPATDCPHHGWCGGCGDCEDCAP